MIGIYKITNNINGKCYIGQSIDIERRFNEHKSMSRSSRLLTEAFIKYGIENFIFEVLEECNKNILDEREIYYIKKFKSQVPNGYNLTEGGDGRLGYKLTENEICKLRDRMIGNDYGKHRSKSQPNISKSLKGKEKSEIHRKHLSESQKGRKLSQEHKDKIGNRSRGKIRITNGIEDHFIYEKDLHNYPGFRIGSSFRLCGKDNPMYGKKVTHSEETRRKISESNKGKKHKKFSDESKSKMSNSRKGKIYINNGINCIMIYPNELESYISIGYIKGRLSK